MQGTKIQILRLLKRGGPASVNDIASELQLAGMTVRQHLVALERDGLVEARDQRRGPGRPRTLYAVSSQGDAMFPRGYDALARGILQEVALLQPHEVAELPAEDKIELLMARYAERTATPYLVQLEGCDIETRALRAAAILDQLSGFIEIEWRPEGVAIRDLNCAYRKVADLGPRVCAWHARFLSVLLGCEVCWVTDGREDCCSFLVPLLAGDGARPLSGQAAAAALQREGRIGWQKWLQA